MNAGFDLVIGRVLYERNELDAAVEHLRCGVGMRFDVGAALHDGFLTLAQAYLAQGDDAAARDASEHAQIEWASTQAEGIRLWAWTGNVIGAHQARLWLAQGDLEAASAWAREIESRMDNDRARKRQPPIFVRELEQIALARVYLAENRIAGALVLLEALGAAAAASGRIARLVEILVLQAIAHQRLGDTDTALGALQRAVESAAPGRFVRAFVDAGPMAQQLLTVLLAQTRDLQLEEKAGTLTRYLETLLAEFVPGASARGDRRDGVSQRAANRLLTSRELQVIRLIATGASNRAIAHELVIALATANRHVKNILHKLGVRSRTEAIVRALALHLVDADAVQMT